MLRRPCPCRHTSSDTFTAHPLTDILASMSRNMSIMSTMMIIRYDVRPDDEGWTIYDRRTDEPAFVEDEQIVGLPKRDAEEIADMLNTLALMQGQQTMH